MPKLHDISIAAQDSPSIDAFGRWRVSNPATLFDSSLIGADDSRLWDTVVSGGTFAYTAGSYGILAVSTLNQYVVRETFQRFRYQPGKSHQILITFNMNGHDANVTKQVGYYNSSTVAPFTANYDGIYLKSDGTNFSLNQAKNGSVTSVNQSSWNLDVMDGTGASGVTLDWTKAQILFIDMEWLGVGRVRCGFVVDGKIYYVHEFLNANSVSVPYSYSATHSIRYEIRTGGSAGAGDMYQICSAVMSEGGQDKLGIPVSAFTQAASPITINAGVYKPLVSIRINTTYPETVAEILDFGVVSTGNDAFQAFLTFNPTQSASFSGWATLGRGLQYDTNSGGGITVASHANLNHILGGVEGSTASLQAASTANDGWRPGISVAGTADELTLVVKALTNGTFEGHITVREM